MNNPAHVFMLQHLGTNRFLLGWSKNVAVDLKHLASSQFDLRRSRFIAVQDVASASHLASTLQHAFANSIVAEHTFPGACWLPQSSWGRVLKFLDHVQDLVPHETVQHAVQLSDWRDRMARERWTDERLKQLQQNHERAKLSAENQAYDTARLLTRLFEYSSFVAIVRTTRHYVLVGLARNGSEFYVNDTLDTLMLSTSGIDAYHFDDSQEDGLALYAAELSHPPGQVPEPADTWYGWSEHAAWQQQSGIPGLDVTLGWQEAKRAADILAKCPGAIGI